MAKIYPFPNQAARALIHSVIQLYAAGKWTRQQMMDRIHQTMKHYGCTTLHFENFTVRITEPVVTSMGQFNVAIIESHSISSRLGCPVCYSAEAGYLAGDKVITAACRDCGCIYKFREKEVLKMDGNILTVCPGCGEKQRVMVHFPSLDEKFEEKVIKCESCGIDLLVTDKGGE